MIETRGLRAPQCKAVQYETGTAAVREFPPHAASSVGGRPNPPPRDLHPPLLSAQRPSQNHAKMVLPRDLLDPRYENKLGISEGTVKLCNRLRGFGRRDHLIRDGSVTTIGVLEFDEQLDLHRGIKRENRHADSRSCVVSTVPEDGPQQLRCPIEHQMLFCERGV